MRKILALLSVFSMIAVANVASAAPVAWYNPGNGGIYFKNDSGAALANASILSLSGKLKTAADLLAINGATKDDSELPFAFTYLGLPAGDSFAGSIVAPGTLGTEMTFEYRTGSLTGPLLQGELITVPEPATIAMGGLGLIGVVAAARRRKA